MSVVAGIGAALLLLLMLAAIGAAVVVLVGLSVIERVVDRFRHRSSQLVGDQTAQWTPTVQDADEEDVIFAELQDSPSTDWFHTIRGDGPLTWHSATGESGPETVIVSVGPRPGATATAQRSAGQQTVMGDQMWIIHFDHTAHWQEDAGDCPLCRDEPR